MNATVLTLLSMLLLAPPSGRPPTGALERYEPRIYDVRFEVSLSTFLPDDVRYRLEMDLRDAPIVMPVIFQSTYSRTDPESLKAHLWLNNVEDKTLQSRARTDAGYPHHTHLAVMPIVEFRGQTLRWNIAYQSMVWSSRINEEAAAAITWPREWPKEVADGLQPQMYIESDAPIFKETVDRISEGNLRMVPPYLAAKDLVRFCINEIQVTGNGAKREDYGALRGLHIVGARRSVTDNSTDAEQRPGPHDLVCVCVAMLRAAGIPARPVIGITKNDKGRNAFVSWAEFWLPDCGWIPFDPVAMRSKGIRHRNVRDPWPEFGTMKDLNRRVPLAYHFMPPMSVQAPQYPAVWGWDPRPAGAPTVQQEIRLSLMSRGRGKEEPK